MSFGFKAFWMSPMKFNEIGLSFLVAYVNTILKQIYCLHLSSRLSLKEYYMNVLFFI